MALRNGGGGQVSPRGPRGGVHKGAERRGEGKHGTLVHQRYVTDIRPNRDESSGDQILDRSPCTTRIFFKKNLGEGEVLPCAFQDEAPGVGCCESTHEKLPTTTISELGAGNFSEFSTLPRHLGERPQRMGGGAAPPWTHPHQFF